MPPITPDDLANWFTYHAPTGTVAGTEIEKSVAYLGIRDAAHAFTRVVVALTPTCADQTVAVRKIREAVMIANQAIACEGK